MAYSPTLSPFQTACGGVDIIAHASERYFTVEHDDYFTDRLSEAVIKTVRHFLPIAMKDPTSYEARSNIMWAATMAMNGIFGVGQMNEMAVHKMQQEVGGLYDSAHGAGVACLALG